MACQGICGELDPSSFKLSNYKIQESLFNVGYIYHITLAIKAISRQTYYRAKIQQI